MDKNIKNYLTKEDIEKYLPDLDKLNENEKKITTTVFIGIKNYFDEKFDEKFKALSSYFDEKFKALTNYFDEKFKALTNYFDEKFDSLNKKVGVLTERVENLEENQTELSYKLDDLSRTQSYSEREVSEDRSERMRSNLQRFGVLGIKVMTPIARGDLEMDEYDFRLPRANSWKASW